MSQTFYFTEPYATTKVRLDEFDGAPEIAFSVEFLGLDRKKRNLVSDPMSGGYMTTSTDLTMCISVPQISDVRNPEPVRGDDLPRHHGDQQLGAHQPRL